MSEVFNWSESNSLKFNVDKLELLRINGSKRLDDSHYYIGPLGSPIPQVETSKDLGIIFNKNGSFKDHIEGKCSKARQICGYILRTFITRDSGVMLTLFKSLVLPILEYGCILWNPFKLSEIRCLEQVQRNFTSRIELNDELNYWDRLKKFKLYSLERRRERYIILYVFKIIKGIVPNPGISWKVHERRGLELCYPPIKGGGKEKHKTMKHQSFFVKSVRLFNCLPKRIRSIGNSVDMLTIKYHLDEFLADCPDEPRLQGYTVASRSVNNELTNQVMLP